MTIYEVRVQASKRTFSHVGFFTNPTVANDVAEMTTPLFEDIPAEIKTHSVVEAETLDDYKRLQAIASLDEEVRQLLGL